MPGESSNTHSPGILEHPATRKSPRAAIYFFLLKSRRSDVVEDDLRIICYGRPNSLVRGYSRRFIYVGGIRNHPEDSSRDEIL
jgi:hypothetical protein